MGYSTVKYRDSIAEPWLFDLAIKADYTNTDNEHLAFCAPYLEEIDFNYGLIIPNYKKVINTYCKIPDDVEIDVLAASSGIDLGILRHIMFNKTGNGSVIDLVHEGFWGEARVCMYNRALGTRDPDLVDIVKKTHHRLFHVGEAESLDTWGLVD